MNTRLRTALLLILLFFAAWLPRVLALDAFVTPDERKWLARSANFYQAISHADLANTFQREHPGVTVMWAGMLGFLGEYPNYANVSPGQFTWDREYFEMWLAEKTSVSALELLTAGRWWIVLGVALAIALGFLPLRRLFGEAIAVLATLFIAWDPFSIALSRQLHPDGLVSSLTFLALISFLAWLYAGQQRRYLVCSGVVMGLAWLTKTPAIFLVPTGLLLVALEWLRPITPPTPQDLKPPLPQDPNPPPQPRTLWLGYLLWGVIASATFVVLWPAMWVDPFGSLLRMAGEMSDYVERHTNVNYFLGQPSADPGLIFYPISFLFRITPAVLIGLIAALPLALRRAAPFDRPLVRRAALALLLFALIFSTGMTIGAKKFDRYILPAHLVCDVLAALGWVGIGAAILRKWRDQVTLRAAAGVATIGLIALHAIFSVIHFPYYLTYYNPLLGGGATAQRVLFVGWGEGLEQAAEWINQQPDADRLRAASWYYDGPFSYYFDGAAVNMGDGSPLFWLGVDYAVTYVNQLQRQLPSPEAVDYFARLTPVHTVSFRGVDLAQVYDMRNMPPPDFLDLPTESAADFGGKLRLLAHEFDQQNAAAGDTVTLYLQSMAEMDVNYNVLLRLVGQDGRELWRSEGWPWGAPTADWPLAETRPDGHPIDVPEDAAAGLYKFVLSFYDPATLEPLRVTTLDGASPPDDTARDLALLRIGPPPVIASPLDPPWSFGGIASLEGADLPATIAAGDPLALTLAWRSLDRTPNEYTVFVHVVGPDGQLVAQSDGPPLAGFAPTRIWQPGQTLLDEHLVQLPDDLAPGQYEVRVGLYAQDGSRLPVMLGETPVGDYAALGAVKVENPAE